jgi:pimeloyl-ACP methyl ester carboxylesterase
MAEEMVSEVGPSHTPWACSRIPTLVMHGDADKMCDPSGGRATAAAIPGAELVAYPGMGHSLPRKRAEQPDGNAASRMGA